MKVIEIKNVSKIYGKGDSKTIALDKVNFDVFKGDFISIMGPSGSGKSTLLNIIGCMDIPTKGEYNLNGRDVSGLSNRALSKIRNKEISFVFQHFALLNNYSVYENIELPLAYRKISRKEKKSRIENFAQKLGIADLLRKKPLDISGGQQQRVAIARALAAGGEIILADEPTGALDQNTGKDLLNILKSINEEGSTIIIVTHDINVSKYCKRNIYIHDGNIIEDKTQNDPCIML